MGKPGTTIPKRFKFLFDPPLGQCRHRAAYGGRGSAKSHSFAEALLIHGRQRPLRILCCREHQKSIRASVKQLLVDKIAQLGFTDFYDVHDTEIRGKNGTLFLFAGLWLNVQGLKSMEGLDLAWVEEANTVSQSSINLLTPTLRKETSELWWTWNPDLETDPVDKMFRGGVLPPRTIVKRAYWYHNTWFPQVLREDMEFDRARDPDKYAHVWLGEYRRNSEARVFNNFRIGDPSEFDDCADWIWNYGADWGYAVDPTAGGRAAIVGRTIYVDHTVHAHRCPIDYLPALFAGSDPRADEALGIKPRWDNPKGYPGLPDALRWEIRADSARPETIKYMKDRGFRMTPSLKGPGSVEEGLTWLQSYDIVAHPRKENRYLIDEFTLFSYEIDKVTGVVLPKIAKKQQDHHIDWMRYALELHRRNAKNRLAVPLAVPIAAPYFGGT